MQKDISYTIEEIAQLLKVSKLTIYELIKKGELPVFRVGRQMRMDAKDLDLYMNKHKSTQMATVPLSTLGPQRIDMKDSQSIVISGQDIVLDILGKHIEKVSSYKTLRSYSGSLNSLISLYNGDCDIVSLHMFDGETGEYNLPYVKRILTGNAYVLINLIARKAGLLVRKGNPLQIKTWTDLKRGDVQLMNREKGSGARILLDEQLHLNQISANMIHGYDGEETSHLSVASAVSTGKADVGIGIEKAAKMVGIDFVPLMTERYDLVMVKTPENEALIQHVKDILSSDLFQTEISSLGDYDVSQTGMIMYETN
ncbi:substrate-binding domain-containing protein [Neobacillus jeddahensis]|uniref:substrate-binding domain-containing protein n=1 Tax=Neobacillus jeddahensis TaxID=1461580 RepID=UPI00058C2ED1|nr:helix-turn-helix transcriptional regulator [Neobacillus jeddahensis]